MKWGEARIGIFDRFRRRKKTGISAGVRIGYFCAKCGVRWDTAKMEMLYGGFGRVSGMIRPGSSQYAGRCPQCGNLYCARCATLDGVTFHCPNCKSTLKAALHG